MVNINVELKLESYYEIVCRIIYLIINNYGFWRFIFAS